MTTGKVEYESYATVMEHQRLKDAVVEAAKAWRAERLRITSITYPPKTRTEMLGKLDWDFDQVVDALITFESEHSLELNK